MSWQQTSGTRHLLRNELGTVYKDWGGRLPIALVYPNSYHVGMSSLALHALYGLWNAREDVVCERGFTASAGLGRSGRKPSPTSLDHGLKKTFALESGAPLDFFPVVAFSVSFEMDYFNVAALLRSAGIPPRAADRDQHHPLVIAGGPAVSANPEPLAPFLDAVVIGEVEPVFSALTNALHLVSDDRDRALDALAQLPGLYLPNRHPAASQIQTVRRQWLPDLDSVPTHSTILTPLTEFANMGLIEIARGCGRGCRFCLAGYAYRPPRQRSVESILAQARELLRHSSRLGLVSAAVSDHSEIDRLARDLRDLKAQISVSSMRVDPVSEPLIRALAESGSRTLTIAPEAGSERLRRLLGKTQTERDVIRAVELAAQYKLHRIKLYFMMGLPTEEEADVRAIVDMVVACADRFPGEVTVNIAPFVPKAHTPFQRLEQAPAQLVKRHVVYVERNLRRLGVGVRSESPAWAEIQGTLARGDRRLADAILAVDSLTPTTWQRILADLGLSMQEYLCRRDAKASLPWDFIDSRSLSYETELFGEKPYCAAPD